MTANASHRFLVLGILVVWATHGDSAQLVDDRGITIHSAKQLAEKRKAVIQYLWGGEGFPSKRMPDFVQTNITHPVKELTHLARVDEFQMELAPGLQALAYHFVAEKPNRELV